MVSVISTLMLDVSHAIEVLVLCLPLEVQDSIQQLHFEYSNTCLQSCLIRNTYTSITSAWCVRSSYCFLSGTTCVLVTVQYITTSPLLLSTLYNISWHLRLNNSFLGCRLRFRWATNFNLSLKLSCNLSVFMLFTKLYDLVLSSSFYSSTASTAQHSTAQHSTAQHSTAQHSTAQLLAFARCLYSLHLYKMLDHLCTYYKYVCHSVPFFLVRERSGPATRSAIVLLLCNNMLDTCVISAGRSNAPWATPRPPS